MKNKYKSLAWVALYCTIAIGSQLVLGVILACVLMSFGMTHGMMNNQDEFTDFYMQMVNYFQQGGALLIINALWELIMLACFGTWYYFRENKYTFRPNYKKAFSRKNMLCIIGIGFLGQYALDLLLTSLKMMIPSIFEQYENLMKNLDMGTLPPVVLILLVGVFGPIVEEIIFRGMIFGKLRRAFRFLPAALISALIFGIYHLNWVQGIYAAVFGVILAYVYEKTQTIWGSCLLHIVFNSSSYLIAWYETTLRSSGLNLSGYLYLAVDVVSFVIVILLLKKMKNQSAKQK